MSQAETKDFLVGCEKEVVEFYEVHGVQLVGMGFPADGKLISSLYAKVSKQIFDAGDYFEILANEDENRFLVQAKQDIKAFEHVFLVDHSFSFRYLDLRSALEQNETLKNRLLAMLKFSESKKSHPQIDETNPKGTLLIEEYDNQEIEDPSTLEISKDVEILSLCGNLISDFEKLKNFLANFEKLKVLWLNENPISEESEKLRAFIEENYPKIEILNSKFTKNLTLWGLRFAHTYPRLDLFDTFDISKANHLKLSSRNIFELENFDIFKELPNLKSIDVKDHVIGDFVHMNRLIALMKSISQLKNIDCDQELSDILWDLHKNKKLKDLAPKLFSINRYHLVQSKPRNDENDITYIINNIWKICGTYRLASSEQLDETNVWYVMDEFGSAINHDFEANSITPPFLYVPSKKIDQTSISYSLLIPTKDIAAGEELTRNYLYGETDESLKVAKSYVWFDVPDKFFLDAYRERESNMKKISDAADKVVFEKKEDKFDDKLKLPLKVLTDYDILKKYLSNPDFKLTNDLEDADIVWTLQSIREDLSNFKGRFVNQFPFEACIINKKYLANTINQGIGDVNWLQRTYDLNSNKELYAFIGDFITRKQNNEDNYWIIKPPNLARSIDMIVTDNLETILRFLEVGPRLAQKYITNPITINKRKFDLRMYATVKSINPPQIYLNKYCYARSANNEYNTDPRSFQNYETHWTVMKYKGLDVVFIEDFIALFEKENKNVKWPDVYEKIKKVVEGVFKSVFLIHPNMHFDMSRAIYGMDIMIDENYDPKLLEFTFSPDCERITKTYPTFFNDTFDCLFLNKSSDMIDRII